MLPGKGEGLRKAPTAAGRSYSVCPWPQRPGPPQGKGGGHFSEQKMKGISKSSNMKMAVTPQARSQRAACAGPMPRVCKAGCPGREGLLHQRSTHSQPRQSWGACVVRLPTPRLPPESPGRMRSAHSSPGLSLCPLPLLGLGRLRGAPAQCASLHPRAGVLPGASLSPSSSAFG